LVVRQRDSHESLTSLSDLAADLLAGVTHALALVRLGLAELANLRGGLSDRLLVDAHDAELGRTVGGEGDAFGGVEHYRVGAAELALLLGRALRQDAVTDAHDLELLLVTLGHADHPVVDQGAGQAVQRASFTLVVGALHLEDTVLALHDADRCGNRVVQGALRALHGHQVAINGDVDAGRDRDGELANTRHCLFPLSVSSLPDVGEDFPTYALLVCLAVGQEALARRDDRDTEAAEHL